MIPWIYYCPEYNTYSYGTVRDLAQVVGLFFRVDLSVLVLRKAVGKGNCCGVSSRRAPCIVRGVVPELEIQRLTSRNDIASPG